MLFIVPDPSDEILATSSPEVVREYFHQIVDKANQDLAPYERVVNFTILDRDFSLEENEITPKGSFNRKVIEDHFRGPQSSGSIAADAIALEGDRITVKIPRWFFRDLGILEDDILFDDQGLYNRRTGRILPLRWKRATSTLLLGNLEYHCPEPVVDLGLFTLQPRLWAGNPMLIRFAPCKEGWHVRFDPSAAQVHRPWKAEILEDDFADLSISRIRDHQLLHVNRLMCRALFNEDDAVREAALELGRLLSEADERLADLVRRRLEALSRHPSEVVRCLAFRILLMDAPTQDYSRLFPAFLESGLTFLNHESIREIALNRMEGRRLEILRKRLLNYREQLDWPGDQARRRQLENVFKLLVNFVEYHSEYYHPVRVELSNWTLHKADPDLAEIAAYHFSRLSDLYEGKLAEEAEQYTADDWVKRLVYEETLSADETERIKEVLVGHHLPQAIRHARLRRRGLRPEGTCPSRGIWITRLATTRFNQVYRVSINTRSRKHYDLQLQVRENFLLAPEPRDRVLAHRGGGGIPMGPTCCRASAAVALTWAPIPRSTTAS